MADLVRDSVFGHFVRMVSKNKAFQYAEEKDPSIWEKFVSAEKSGNMAHHGSVEPEEESDKDKETGTSNNDSNSATSSSTQVGGGEATTVNKPSGKKVDAEKGRDLHMVDWYGPDDPDVSSSLP